jgi:hypothetical protein
VDEVWLIEIAARQCDVGPVDVAALLQGRKHVPKPRDMTIGLRREPDFGAERRNELRGGPTDSRRNGADSRHAARAVERAQREAHAWAPPDVLAKTREQESLEHQEPRESRAGLKHEIAEVARCGA